MRHVKPHHVHFTNKGSFLYQNNIKHEAWSNQGNQPTTTNQTTEKRSKQTTSQCISTSFPGIREFAYSTNQTWIKNERQESRTILGGSRAWTRTLRSRTRLPHLIEPQALSRHEQEARKQEIRLLVCVRMEREVWEWREREGGVSCYLKTTWNFLEILD